MVSIKEVAKQLAQHKLVPFFGAGVSSAHLGVVWKDVSDAMADELALALTDRGDFLEVAEKYEHKFGRPRLCEFLSSRLIAVEFDDAKGVNHLLLLSFAAGILYTTNQDNLFELAAAKKGRPHRVIVELSDLGALLPGEFALVKYHGDLAKPDSVIFTRSSYQRRIADVDHFLNIRLRSDLLAKSFLFVGYSFSDPNVRLLFEEVHAAFRGRTPISYLIAYRYDPSMDRLTTDFGVQIINPLEAFPHAADAGEAFARYLSELNKEVVRQKVTLDIDTVFRSPVPSSARVATSFDVDAVVAVARGGDFRTGLTAFRATFDRTVIPDDLQMVVGETFRTLANQATAEEDLQELAASLFNLRMPPDHIMNVAAGIIIAVNRINPVRDFLPFVLMCPAAPDYVMAMAAAAAVAEIKHKGGTINEGFRINARQWLLAFDKLPDGPREIVRQVMETAWRDSGRLLPPDLFGRGVFPSSKSFSEIKDALQSMLPKRFTKPYD